MNDIVTSILEITTIAAILAALTATALILGFPWGYPIGLLTLAATTTVIRAGITAQRKAGHR